MLRSGADPVQVRARLQGQGLDVTQAVNPADRLAIIRVIIVGLVAVLALIGLASLLTASALGLRDHVFDLAVLKAMGLTPRQVMATLVTATGLPAAVGVVCGGRGWGVPGAGPDRPGRPGERRRRRHRPRPDAGHARRHPRDRHRRRVARGADPRTAGGAGAGARHRPQIRPRRHRDHPPGAPHSSVAHLCGHSS